MSTPCADGALVRWLLLSITHVHICGAVVFRSLFAAFSNLGEHVRNAGRLLFCPTQGSMSETLAFCRSFQFKGACQ
eukprot:1158621-Pelagomonas_calceolata.AAC.2